MPKVVSINPTPSNSTVVLEQVLPTDPPSAGIGQQIVLTNFFDGGFNVAPTAVLPPINAPSGMPGPGMRITIGQGAAVKFVNPA